MDNLDKKTMIHVAVELVIIIGIAFWLNSKINAKDEKIELLEKQVLALTQKLAAIENYLTGGRTQPQQPPSGGGKPKGKKSDLQTTTSEEEVMSEGDEEIEI